MKTLTKAVIKAAMLLCAKLAKKINKNLIYASILPI